MPPVGFEPTISAGGRQQTYDLDRGATGTGIYINSLQELENESAIYAVSTDKKYKIYFNILPYPKRCNFTKFIYIWKLLYIFGWYLHPSSGAHTTVSTASGICHTVTATCRYRAGVECPPDDGWRYHPKHVEQFPDKINCVKLHLVGYILE